MEEDVSTQKDLEEGVRFVILDFLLQVCEDTFSKGEEDTVDRDCVELEVNYGGDGDAGMVGAIGIGEGG